MLARMPLNFSDHPVLLGPASGTIGEVGMEPTHLVRRSPDWALEQPTRASLTLKSMSSWKPSAEIDARDLAPETRHDRVEHFLPAVRAVHVAGTQSAAFQIGELVEHKQRMIAGAGVIPVSHAHLLLAVRRAHARIHVEYDASRRSAAVHKVDPLAG